MATKQWERSTNGGRTWEATPVQPRSPLTAVRLDPGEPYDDGMGNLYRYTVILGPGPVYLPSPETLAHMFHRNYERLAPEYGYRTRDASAVPWADVPEDNRQLMIATAAAVIKDLSPTDETGS